VRRAVAAGIVVAAAAAAIVVAVRRRGSDDGARCGPGFVAEGTRCTVPAGACPPPLARLAYGCDAPDVRVLVPAAAVALGPSDWEAEGRVRPHTFHVQAFRIDAFEATRGRVQSLVGDSAVPDDPARAASGITRPFAETLCGLQGGRLPTEDEWVVAAASAVNPPRRYAWGDTGAVCRRGAWGLVTGPCGEGATGPDTVGSHPDGDSPLGLHDLAGDVAEWVAGEPAAVKGGSFADALASELRILARREVPPDAVDARVGFRCVYPP
jgi:formylglycine-generating enzyme required for sulfatase activity